SVLLEQNAHPGLANRALARLAQRVCTTFAEANRYFPAAKVVVTGNPVRLFAALPPGTRAGFTLLVFGGSQGAHRLNEAMGDGAAGRGDGLGGSRIIHQPGWADCPAVRDRYARLGIAADVREFIEDMGAAYAAADLVVCRAGATTVAELTALGKPAI